MKQHDYPSSYLAVFLAFFIKCVIWSSSWRNIYSANEWFVQIHYFLLGSLQVFRFKELIYDLAGLLQALDKPFLQACLNKHLGYHHVNESSWFWDSDLFSSTSVKSQDQNKCFASKELNVSFAESWTSAFHTFFSSLLPKRIQVTQNVHLCHFCTEKCLYCILYGHSPAPEGN